MDFFNDSRITQSSLQFDNPFIDCFSSHPSSTIFNEKISTFLRIRPLNNIPIESTAYSIYDSTRLSVEIEEKNSVQNVTKVKHDNRKVFSFNHIFDSSSNQLNVFTKCCLPLVNDVLEGTNALLFCFGTTSSGKSYTMRGPSNDPASDPGLIPLSLKKIFSSRQFIDAPLIGKSKFNDICLLDKDQQLMEKQFKESILSSSCCRNVSALPSVNNEFNFNKDGYQYICYLSYFEIYNDIVYDLLVPSSNGRSSPLTLFHDERQRFYVKDLKSVMVSTLTEALQIYSFGWTNLQRNIQETGLNKNSSRSHSFLCITLIKFKEDEGQVIESQVSHLTLGDLAGTERQNVTDTEGMRVKEGGNINVSLMHLKECFNQTKLNQKNPSKNFVIPFRNSSLTKFFQPYLTGTGRVWMIININPSPNLLQETLGSLEFNETASYISTNSVRTPNLSLLKMSFNGCKQYSFQHDLQIECNFMQLQEELKIAKCTIKELQLSHDEMRRKNELLEKHLSLIKTKADNSFDQSSDSNFGDNDEKKISVYVKLCDIKTQPRFNQLNKSQIDKPCNFEMIKKSTSDQCIQTEEIEWQGGFQREELEKLNCPLLVKAQKSMKTALSMLESVQYLNNYVDRQVKPEASDEKDFTPIIDRKKRRKRKIDPFPETPELDNEQMEFKAVNKPQRRLNSRLSIYLPNYQEIRIADSPYFKGNYKLRSKRQTLIQ